MLDQSALSDSLEAIFASLPPTPAECAAQLAQAYVDYAGAGTFGASLPTLDDDRRDAMAATLEGAISDPAVGLPATFAAAWASALTVFWTAVPVAGPQLGVTNGCPGASSLTGSLTGVLANLANTAETCASGMASAIHAATMTVQATVSPPPGTVVPIA